MSKKQNIGKLNCLIYFLDSVEDSSTKDELGGFESQWIPALGGTVSDTAEAGIAVLEPPYNVIGGTTETNLKLTAHGLSDGDYIVNQTRGNELRTVTVVDANNLTVASVTGQNAGDIIIKKAYSLSRVWASINSKSSFYQMESQQKTTRVTHVIEVRNREDIITRYRIQFENRYFEIISMYDPTESDERLVLECRELTL